MARYKPGESGNKAGRPKGSGRIGEYRAALDGLMPSVLKKVVEAALAGDMQAARIIIGKVLPDMKAADATAPISMTGATLSDKAASIMQAVAEGHVAVDAGASLVGMLQRVGELRDAGTLVQRVEALEKLAAAQHD